MRSLGRSAVVFDENNNKLVHLTSELKTFKVNININFLFASLNLIQFLVGCVRI